MHQLTHPHLRCRAGLAAALASHKITAPLKAANNGGPCHLWRIGLKGLAILSCCGSFFTASAANWQAQDIGEVGLTGAFSQTANGGFTVSGAGADIWNAADAFRFGFQPLAGDGTIVVRVVDANPQKRAKVGVMIRESLQPDAKYATLFVSPSGRMAFEQRTEPAGLAAWIAGLKEYRAPCWLSLQRQGNVFTAYNSVDGRQWNKLGMTTIAMGKSAFIGLVVCSQNPDALCEAQFDNVAVKSSYASAERPKSKTLPATATTLAKPITDTSAWQTSDIGEVGLTGSFSQALGTFSLSGAGADIWRQADAFRFAYSIQTGDCTFTARVLQVEKSDDWAKAGLMIRETPAPNSKYALAFMTPEMGAVFQQRIKHGEWAELGIVMPKVRPPYWIRLTRQNNVFTAYTSPNGTSWSKLGTTTIDMDATVCVGLAVTAHNVDALCHAEFDSVTVQPGVKVSK